MASEYQIDKVLSNHKQLREKIIQKLSDPDYLIEKLWSGELLSRDPCCRAQTPGRGLYDLFICWGCKQLRIMGKPVPMGDSDKIMQIECGERRGKHLAISSVWATQVYLRRDPSRYQRAQSFFEPNSTAISPITIVGDKFTIKTLLNWWLQTKTPHVPRCDMAFLCRNLGYSVYDFPEEGTLEQLAAKRGMVFDIARPKVLSPPQIYSIWKQVMGFFLSIGDCNFSYYNLNTHSCVFSSEPCSYEVSGLRVEGPFTLWIAELSNAALTIENCHYAAERDSIDSYSPGFQFRPIIRFLKVDNDFCSKQAEVCARKEDCRTGCILTSEQYYSISKNDLEIFQAFRQSGYPVFPSSFDFYCLMISLMTHVSFRTMVYRNESLIRLWNSLWVNNENTTVESRVLNYREGHYRSAELLVDLQLQANVIPNFLRFLQEIDFDY